MEDRLAELRKKRSREGSSAAAAAAQVDVEMGVRAESGGEQTGMEQVMVPYVRMKEALAKIQGNTRSIDELQLQSKMSSSEEDQKRILADLDEVMSESQALSKQVKQSLDTLREENRAFAADNPHSSTTAWRNNLLSTHTRHFQTAVLEFQNASEGFKQSQREQIARRFRIVKRDATEDEIEEVLHSDNPLSFMQQAMMMPDALVNRVADIEERHEGMMRIEQGVRELQELFNDLALLVDLQQEKLDVIEYNVQQTKGYTEEAEKNIKQAEIYAKKARKRQCCILIICLVILAVILIPTLTLALPGG